MAKEGFPFIFLGCALTGLCLYFHWAVPSIIFGLLGLFTIAFFRDPERRPLGPHNAILAPADGRIIQIKEMDSKHSPLGEACVKISIFMTIFNVHVNRIPISGTILDLSYHPGRFISAHLDKASEHNERNGIILQLPDSRKIMFVQIAGLIARRIVCWVGKGDQVERGQRFGLIRFGSRVDIYVPPDSQIIVQYRQRVNAGKTIIGYLS